MPWMWPKDTLARLTKVPVDQLATLLHARSPEYLGYVDLARNGHLSAPSGRGVVGEEVAITWPTAVEAGALYAHLGRRGCWSHELFH